MELQQRIEKDGRDYYLVIGDETDCGNWMRVRCTSAVELLLDQICGAYELEIERLKEDLATARGFEHPISRL